MNNLLEQAIKEVKHDMNSMKYFIYQTYIYKIKPKIIFDIGSYNAAHLKELGDTFDVPMSACYAFEAHPGMIKHCQNRSVNVIKSAVSNYDGRASFHAIDLSQKCHHACSSLFDLGVKNKYRPDRPFHSIMVNVNRIDSLMMAGKLPINPDMVKIDVEGKSYEVLEGFGKFLKNVKIFHIETEIRVLYKDQKLENDIIALMMKNGFKIIHSLDIELQRDYIFLNKAIL